MSGEFSLNISTTGAAYTMDGADPATSVADNLREVVEKLEYGYTSGTIMDVNGNTTGKWELN